MHKADGYVVGGGQAVRGSQGPWEGEARRDWEERMRTGAGGGCSGEQPWGSWGSRSACRPLCPPAEASVLRGAGSPSVPTASGQPSAQGALSHREANCGSSGQRNEWSQEQTRTVKGQGAAVAMAAATLTTEGRSSGVCGVCEGECSKRCTEPGY